MSSPTVADVLESLGVKLSLDFDDTAVAEFPEKIHVEQLRLAFERWTPAISADLVERARKLTRRFIGGPLDGRSTVNINGNHNAGEFFVTNISRGKWAVYEKLDWKTCRFIFRGFATSYRNGRKGRVST